MMTQLPDDGIGPMDLHQSLLGSWVYIGCPDAEPLKVTLRGVEEWIRQSPWPHGAILRDAKVIECEVVDRVVDFSSIFTAAETWEGNNVLSLWATGLSNMFGTQVRAANLLICLREMAEPKDKASTSLATLVT